MWTRRTSIAASLLAAAIGALALSPVVEGARRPTSSERDAIRKAALSDCAKQGGADEYPCSWRGNTRVSTVNSRYAWASVSGPSYDNSGILRRPTRSSRNWRMIRVAGGGIQPCSYWYKVAPRAVVRDLKIRGFTEGSGNFTYHRC